MSVQRDPMMQIFDMHSDRLCNEIEHLRELRAHLRELRAWWLTSRVRKRFMQAREEADTGHEPGEPIG